MKTLLTALLAALALSSATPAMAHRPLAPSAHPNGPPSVAVQMQQGRKPSPAVRMQQDIPESQRQPIVQQHYPSWDVQQHYPSRDAGANVPHRWRRHP